MSEARAIPVIKLVNHQSNQSSAVRDEVRDLLENIVVKMVGTKQGVAVTYMVGERTTVFKVDCPKEFLGRLIGSKGKNISSLRNVLSAMMWPEGIRAIVEIPYYKPEDK